MRGFRPALGRLGGLGGFLGDELLAARCRTVRLLPWNVRRTRRLPALRVDRAQEAALVQPLGERLGSDGNTAAGGLPDALRRRQRGLEIEVEIVAVDPAGPRALARQSIPLMLPGSNHDLAPSPRLSTGSGVPPSGEATCANPPASAEPSRSRKRRAGSSPA